MYVHKRSTCPKSGTIKCNSFVPAVYVTEYFTEYDFTSSSTQGSHQHSSTFNNSKWPCVLPLGCYGNLSVREGQHPHSSSRSHSVWLKLILVVVMPTTTCQVYLLSWLPPYVQCTCCHAYLHVPPPVPMG